MGYFFVECNACSDIDNYNKSFQTQQTDNGAEMKTEIYLICGGYLSHIVPSREQTS